MLLEIKNWTRYTTVGKTNEHKKCTAITVIFLTELKLSIQVTGTEPHARPVSRRQNSHTVNAYITRQKKRLLPSAKKRWVCYV